MLNLRRLSSTGLLLALLLPGCTPAPDSGPTATFRDSAGVTIVENLGEVPSGGGGWAVGPEPVLSIGTFEGDTLYQLYRVQGAARLSSGVIAVVNSGSGQIRTFDESGIFLGSVGRKGEGPGEFESPALAGVLGVDTLVVVDFQLRRVSLIHTESGFLKDDRITDEVGGGGFPQGMFQDRTLVLGGGFFWSSDGSAELSDGYSRRSTSYRSCSLGGELLTDFGEFPGSEFYMRVRNQGGGVIMSASLIPFGKYSMSAVGPRHLFIGSGDSHEIQVRDPSGALVRVIRWNRALVPVTEANLAAYVEERAAEAVDENAARTTRQNLAEMPVPDHMPAFAGLSADALGYLWVETYDGPGDELPSYDIFDPEGRMVGGATLPEDMEILEIGEDHLLALFRDELEVEYVRLYDLQRPESTPGP